MRAEKSLRTPALWLAAIALVAFVGSAQAQSAPSCTITGPESGCGSVELCGPEGNYTYYWAPPGGGVQFTRCITATVEGQYSLVITDIASGLSSEPCIHKLTLDCGGGGKCSITGPETVCKGTKGIELCGPVGDGYLYAWTGPEGFTAGTRCITVTVPGEYTLELTVPGAKPETCSHTVKEGDCVVNCPRTIGFWGAQCAQRNDGSSKFTSAQVTSIASCIDGKSAFFNWGDDLAGFCATISPSTTNQRTQAKRQYAALLANLCVDELDLIADNGDEILLDPDTEITCDGSTMTIAQLITFIESELAALEGQSLSLGSVKSRYGKIITCANNINNGIGVGTLCDELELALLSSTTTTTALSNLREADVNDGGALRAYPNPFTSLTRLSYAVAPQGEQVSLGVYDIAGRQVKALFNGFQSGGVHQTIWDGTDVSGARARTGMYFIRGKVGARSVASRVMMVE